ncbi:MAG: UPF0182 family protein [Bacteroidales bacterium]|nr:UPF0182 family protein [Bacteroidales bacterium]
MYTLILILLLSLSGFIIFRGVSKKKVHLMVTGLIAAVIVILFFWFMGFWSDKLWFDQLGYTERFWTVWITRIILLAGTFAAGGIIAYFLTINFSGEIKYLQPLTVLLGALFTGIFWGSNWDVVLKFLNRIHTGMVETILDKDTGFYLFSYPFLRSLYIQLLVLSLIIGFASIIQYWYFKAVKRNADDSESLKQPTASLFISSSFIFLVLAFGTYLARFGILFSEYGIVSGPGWTDANIRLPMFTSLSIIFLLTAILLIMSGLSPALRKSLSTKKIRSELSSIYLLAGSSFAIWFVMLVIVPALFQWLKVEPNEITVEKPYIENNIRFTRSGFHLDKVEKKEFDVSDQLDESTVENNRNLFSNIRLWDYRALDAVFKQFQEIRLYYEFNDVDIDRYIIDSIKRAVMVSAREMQSSNLPVESQTFINKHFKYTHGYGAVLNLVNEFTPDGLPNLLIKDIPPVAAQDNLTVNRPEVYYGELSMDYAVVNSREKEFDYPRGDENIYIHYSGNGGVRISNFWRKLIYGWRYGGTRFLVSSYPYRESRIMLYRQINERIEELTPFLYLDNDPYIVISEGKLYWIMDAYTTSGYYPYSEPFSSFEASYLYSVNEPVGKSSCRFVSSHLEGENYVRNSVKVVIDAYSGKTDFYIFEEDDPLVQVYDKIFPGLLKPGSDMPAALRKHIRYPADMLLVQGLVYAKYHMTDPAVFYNQEDLWVRATEKYYSNVQPVEPYYIMWEPPGSDEAEFILMLPFTPKNKQVMIGWIAGMCDDENYGRFLAYQFPKEKRILGTQQVETKIDQDSFLSGQLTLWDQAGSNVIRGNVLAIPINNTIIYVEPIYLQSVSSAYPELRLVAVMHNDNLSYAETFDQALTNLFAGKKATGDIPEEGVQSTFSLIERAKQAFDNYLLYMQQREFEKAGMELNRLEEALQALSDKSEEQG